MGCAGGAGVASRITAYLSAHKTDYSCVIASRDWHDADNDNGGHFAVAGSEPDWVNNWPVHCVAGTDGAEYHPKLDTRFIDVHVKKGQGKPAYSLFEGTTDSGEDVTELLSKLGVDSVDVCGIATDYCVLASALDAKQSGLGVRVLTALSTGVAEATSEAALEKLRNAGCEVI